MNSRKRDSPSYGVQSNAVICFDKTAKGQWFDKKTEIHNWKREGQALLDKQGQESGCSKLDISSYIDFPEVKIEDLPTAYRKLYCLHLPPVLERATRLSKSSCYKPK